VNASHLKPTRAKQKGEANPFSMTKKIEKIAAESPARRRKKRPH